MSLAFVIAAVVVGMVAGAYVRAMADGFGVGSDGRWKEARAAFGHAIRVRPIPRGPYLIEGFTAAVLALLAWRFSNAALLPILLYAGLVGVGLAVIDWRTQRLPDAITLPSYPIVLGLLAPTGSLPTAVICGLALGGVYAVLWFVRPSALGLGDVKLAGLIGLLSGAVGVNTAILAGFAGQLLGALYAVWLLTTRKGTRRSEFPFGPFMLAGGLLAVLVH